jgi:transposase
VIVGTWRTRADWEAWHHDRQFTETRQRLDELESAPSEHWWHDVVLDGPITRFPDSKHVVSYVGLAPAVDASADKQRLGNITKQGSALLRWVLGQAAPLAARADDDLRRRYFSVLHRRGRPKARVALARKLLVRLYVMLRDQIDYPEFRRRGRLPRPLQTHTTVM